MDATYCLPGKFNMVDFYFLKLDNNKLGIGNGVKKGLGDGV